MNILEIIVKYYTELAMGAVIPSIYLLFKKFKVQKTVFDAIKDAVRDLTRDRITTMWRVCKKDGMTLEDRDSLEALYARYHELGGNGNLSDLYAKLKALPIID